ncbi:MAG: glycoside hydrolase family 3 protein [Solobacterium sp.]|nr:glycoside hydrolase family 3 protein [Solobacterium sp.]
METKKRMNNKTFRTISCAAIALMTAVGVGGTAAANVFSQSLDTYIGRGERKVTETDIPAENAIYYDQQFTDTNAVDGSVAFGASKARTITDEGEVLMKNNGILPLAKGTHVTPLGYRYVDPVYGGTGSGNVDSSKDYIVTPEEGLGEYFSINTTIVNLMKKTTPKELTSDGLADAKGAESGKGFTGATTSILEQDPAVYESEAASMKDTTAIVFIGRVGGEGGNLQTTAYADGTAHELELTDLERDTLAFAKKNCAGVVVILNTSNVMEVGELMEGELEADAILWVGGPGATGFGSMGAILCGDVNPSGRTADIWDADLDVNPATANFAPDRTYTNTTDTVAATNYTGLYFIEFEEGIYTGYRYFETAADLGQMDYDKAVVFPFGYGLSYTTFEQSLKDVKEDGNLVTVTVEVKNTGSVDGKEVVQLYHTAPYTDLDQKYEIEKATKNLLAFDKVFVKAGSSETVTLVFNKEDMASYCDTYKNDDGSIGCWMLEEGDYTITLGKNSHDAWETHDIQIPQTIWYSGDNLRQSDRDAQSAMDEEGTVLNYPAAAEANPDAAYVSVHNRFQDATDYMHEEAALLTRADWKNTQPTAPQAKALSEERLNRLIHFDLENDPVLGNSSSLISTDVQPVSKQDNGLTLSDMRGLSFYDGTWDLLLNQLDYDSEEVTNLLFNSAFTTGPISAIGKPATVDHDGPQGWGMTGAEGGPETCAYPTEVVVASTWNTELAYEYGEAIGQEALVIGFTGWYGPGLNTHRSAFNGRNFEYYSEDALLAGKMAAACISGASDQGVISYVKHFVMDDYEGPTTCLTVWLTEQALRENYLKSYEIAFKEARMKIRYIADSEGTVKEKVMRGATGVMAAVNTIGSDWCFSSYELQTNLLRGEWGFQGAVTTDMFLRCTEAATDMTLRSGTDLKMWFVPTMADDITSATARTAYRRAIKDVCFAYANSNLMQGAAPGSSVTYGTAPWVYMLIAIDTLLAAGIVALIVAMLKRKEQA